MNEQYHSGALLFIYLFLFCLLSTAALYFILQPEALPTAGFNLNFFGPPENAS